MDKKEQFDMEFDFEKDYGFDPKEILDEEPAGEAELNFDLVPEAAQEAQEEEELDFLSDDFLASLGILDEPAAETAPEAPAPEEPVQESEDQDLLELFLDEETAPIADDQFDDLLDELDEDDEPAPAAEPAFEVDPTPDLGEDFEATFDEVAKENGAAAEEASQKPTELADIPKRRRKMSKERIIKEVYLPPIIAGVALLLVLIFIGSAIGRGIRTNREQQEALKESAEAASGALAQEAEHLLYTADRLASGYDYDGALDTLNSFSGDITQYKSMVDAVSAYTQAKNQLKPIDDPASIPNLSFHGLIVDPARAFTDESMGIAYNNHYVTVEEFSKILQQLYDNNYVLVDFDSFIVETTSEDGKTTYSTQPIYLPEGKKPLMLTQTLVNYETFSIDSDGDGEADAGGAGFASKLMVGSNGKITCEYVDGSGNTLVGDYDLVPILNTFLSAHPDFSYRGARAILAVSGEDGVFGYRTMDSVKKDKGEDYYNQQIEGAKAIAQALRNDGYTIACYTYGNVNYSELSATAITADLDAWKREVVPVLGSLDTIVYAKSCDISCSGNRYNVLKDAGFRYFIGASTSVYAEVASDYIHQTRIMVTGKQMKDSPTLFANYFDVDSVLDAQRGTK